MIFDISCLVTAILVSVLIRESAIVISSFGQISVKPIIFTAYTAIMFVFLLIIFGLFRLYRPIRLQLSARLFTIIKAIGLWALVVCTIIYIAKYDFPRSILFMTVIITAMLICICRYLIYRIFVHKSFQHDYRVHIIGPDTRAERLLCELRSRFPKITSVNHVSTDRIRDKLIPDSQAEIFLVGDVFDWSEIIDVLIADRENRHGFRLINHIFGQTNREIRLSEIDETARLVSSVGDNPINSFIRRCLDIGMSLSAILLCIPILALLAFIVKIYSSGTIYIKQERIGKNGKRFTMYKFRTMRSDTPLYEMAPSNGNDPRITRIGRILRRFSLDELPQLWNVLKGDMSIVGPRPEMEFIVKNYKPWQRYRLRVKPGLTGLWQIMGRKDLPLHENLEYDFFYVATQNIVTDISIILKTIPAVIFGKGAY
ncbi:MAG: exopolysaccharide biosynthesis polyprenyl glycosylphosphotransferase [Patescibacteria group bacterium]|nr:exopolysaccharide biosynthesis polyprenyl glycosylphosphotransferase [Patescibacteria group bacterium]